MIQSALENIEVAYLVQCKSEKFKTFLYNTNDCRIATGTNHWYQQI